MLTRSRAGNYPTLYVATVLRFGIAASAHRSSLMPVWGPILGQMNFAEVGYLEERELRISNLNMYLKSIQER
jgi:hypothetical protein